MIPEFTKSQLDELTVHEARPLVICDVDEVVVHFTSNFENFLSERHLVLDHLTIALADNIRDTRTNTLVASSEVSQLVDDFFVERTRNLQPITGAVEALLELGQNASVVMLTNLPHFAKTDRVDNLRDLGLTYPVITNSGPKGPAIKNLAARTNSPVVFVDDSPGFINSAYQYAPHVNLVHFLQDARFAKHTPHFDFVSLRTHHWDIAKPHILNLLAA